MQLPGYIWDDGLAYLPNPVEWGLSTLSRFESFNSFMIRSNSALGIRKRFHGMT